MLQTKEQDFSPKKEQPNEEDRQSTTEEKEFRVMTVKMMQNLENKNGGIDKQTGGRN